MYKEEIIYKIKQFIYWILKKKVCPQCGGSGFYYSEGMAIDFYENDPVVCPTCRGKGCIKRV